MKGGEDQHGNRGQLGEGSDDQSKDQEAQDEKVAAALVRPSSVTTRTIDRLLMFLGISSLSCWVGMMVLIGVAQTEAMPLFLASVGLLLMMGGVMLIWASVVILRFHRRHTITTNK